MQPETDPDDHVRILLLVGLRHFLTADNAEAAFEKVQETAGRPLDPARFHAAVAACIAEGMIREPIRLESNSLHCHWRLELTPKGVETARTLTGT
ncbi:hypothetical protein [Limobrevibacterium gyesilva]|uniref:Uncharacterized protein n=1 Tax=Limobrevibacterium gyesilva TaxID=2991712 RepID=A0AA41YMX4_9PROT|nr:hypothetical protein [Limobrevibacterium gyesilva]MCW3476849.1 hypothetical protein [Limobrevibacterium gyesilva]